MSWQMRLPVREEKVEYQRVHRMKPFGMNEANCLPMVKPLTEDHT